MSFRYFSAVKTLKGKSPFSLLFQRGEKAFPLKRRKVVIVNSGGMREYDFQDQKHECLHAVRL